MRATACIIAATDARPKVRSRASEMPGCRIPASHKALLASGHKLEAVGDGSHLSCSRCHQVISIARAPSWLRSNLCQG
eukprot:5680603-Karenia_brevis.AAC.1